MVSKNNLFYKAAVQHFTAKKQEALAVLEMYFNNSTAIGDHSNILQEIIEHTKMLAEAEESLVVLDHYADDT